MLHRRMPRSSRLRPRLLRRQRRRSRRAPQRAAPNQRRKTIQPPVIPFQWRNRKQRQRRMRTGTLHSPLSRYTIVLLLVPALDILRQQTRNKNPGSPRRQTTIPFPRRNRKQRRRETITKEVQQEPAILRDLEFRTPAQLLLPKAATVPAMRICRSPNLEREISEPIRSWIPICVIRHRMDGSTTT